MRVEGFEREDNKDKINPKRFSIGVFLRITFPKFLNALCSTHTISSKLHDASRRVRTFAGTKPQDLKSCPFDHSGILA